LLLFFHSPQCLVQGVSSLIPAPYSKAVSDQSTNLDWSHGSFDLKTCTYRGHALFEVEVGQQHVLLGVSSHMQQFVPAKVALYERHQIAPLVVDAKLRDHLLE
jgi:hypothetical protein